MRAAFRCVSVVLVVSAAVAQAREDLKNRLAARNTKALLVVRNDRLIGYR